MMQQINLYQPIFRKEQKIFSAQTLLIGNLLVLVGIFVLYGITLWQGSTLQSQLEQTIKQRDDNLNRVTQLAKQYPEKKLDPQLTTQIERTRKRLEFLQEVSTTLFSTSGGIEGGFSGHLAGLSRRDPQKLWLEQITILRGGSEIRLRGLTTQSERVPNYIQQLAHETIFQGTSFHRLSIGRLEQVDQKPQLIRFTLETAFKSSPDTGQSKRLASQRWNVKSPAQILDERMP